MRISVMFYAIIFKLSKHAQNYNKMASHFSDDFYVEPICSLKLRGINSNKKHLNLYYLSSNEKMTLTSLLKPTDMKHLLKALINTQRTAPSPFYLLKINHTHPISTYPDFLFLK